MLRQRMPVLTVVLLCACAKEPSSEERKKEPTSEERKLQTKMEERGTVQSIDYKRRTLTVKLDKGMIGGGEVRKYSAPDDRRVTIQHKGEQWPGKPLGLQAIMEGDRVVLIYSVFTTSNTRDEVMYFIIKWPKKLPPASPN
jgi:hypothetical protein